MFKGSIVAIVTPFNNGAVDEQKLRELVDFQIDNGTDGIVPAAPPANLPLWIMTSIWMSSGSPSTRPKGAFRSSPAPAPTPPPRPSP